MPDLENRLDSMSVLVIFGFKITQCDDGRHRNIHKSSYMYMYMYGYMGYIHFNNHVFYVYHTHQSVDLSFSSIKTRLPAIPLNFFALLLSVLFFVGFSFQ